MGMVPSSWECDACGIVVPADRRYPNSPPKDWWVLRVPMPANSLAPGSESAMCPGCGGRVLETLEGWRADAAPGAWVRGAGE